MRALDKYRIKKANNISTDKEIIEIMESQEFEDFINQVLNSDAYKAAEKREQKLVAKILDDCGFCSHKERIIKFTDVAISFVQANNYADAFSVISELIYKELKILDSSSEQLHIDDLNNLYLLTGGNTEMTNEIKNQAFIY